MAGFNTSILLMLGVVVALLGGFGFLVWSAYRSAPRRIEELRKMHEQDRNPPD